MKSLRCRQTFLLFMAVIFLGLLSLGFSFTPDSPPTRWIGEYECAQGLTDLELIITPEKDGSLTGVFHFQHVSSGAKGRFYLKGNFSPEINRLIFTPGEWIEQPYGYMTVAMEGTISQDPVRYEGTITGPSCGHFKVNLIK